MLQRADGEEGAPQARDREALPEVPDEPRLLRRQRRLSAVRHRARGAAREGEPHGLRARQALQLRAEAPGEVLQVKRRANKLSLV